MSEAAPRPRVLVADDDPAMLAFCRHMIPRIIPEALVDTASSGEEALQLLRTREYSLILSDYAMGYMNGIDLLEIARRDSPQALRIIMTGRAYLELAQEALQRARVNGFIPKPGSAEDLEVQLQQILERRFAA